jgi:hypothetical protein
VWRKARWAAAGLATHPHEDGVGCVCEEPHVRQQPVVSKDGQQDHAAVQAQVEAVKGLGEHLRKTRVAEQGDSLACVRFAKSNMPCDSNM